MRFVGGYHDFRIERGGLQVFPRLVAAAHRGSAPDGSLGSGVAALDALLGGGIERGTSTLLTGAPGTCKSTIAAQFAVMAARRGERAAMFPMPEDKLLSVQLHELLTFLGRCGTATLLVSVQRGLIGTHMDSPVDASYLADTVVLLRYFEAQGSVRSAISVLKKRSGQHERAIREFEIARTPSWRRSRTSCATRSRRCRTRCT
ncbi:ATPase domain-containing protein [Piscinibacter sp.]|uniref:ATPase domain-containing protein n=1 Tax=Piscinibacter sp. TaxID=1903157 RepID=UPI002B6961E6|nr:ATPase domain-containing protein [Albitalea sp.]HUG25184.1 ATPase domain-containing protein [Albitalea sp.]